MRYGCTADSQNNDIQAVMVVPKIFPGHTATPIQEKVEVPDYFDPKEYQQNKLKKEAACVFNSLVEFLMHIPEGRSKLKTIFHSQDAHNVYLKFYFPHKNILEKYESHYHNHINENKEYIEQKKESLELWKKEESSPETNPERMTIVRDSIEDQKKQLEDLQQRAQQLPDLWEKTLSLPSTLVSVSKQFVIKPEGSFPHDNPSWLNLIQQGFMKITKNRFLCPAGECGGYVSEHTSVVEIQEEDSFANITMCSFPQIKSNETIIESLIFFPLVDKELKKVGLFTKKEGLDLEKMDPSNYQGMVGFAHTHGLTKDLLIRSNVIQFGAAGHAVALFFGARKVYFYDNVNYDHLLQRKVYGINGPVYEEAEHFKNQRLDLMGEEEFLRRTFQEIHHRCVQVSEVREQDYSLYPYTNILFFMNPFS